MPKTMKIFNLGKFLFTMIRGIFSGFNKIHNSCFKNSCFYNRKLSVGAFPMDRSPITPNIQMAEIFIMKIEIKRCDGHPHFIGNTPTLDFGEKSTIYCVSRK